MKIRTRAKILWLALRVWNHTRKVRGFKARVEAHMAKYHGRLDKEDKFLLEQLHRIEAEDLSLKNAAQVTITGWRILGDE